MRKRAILGLLLPVLVILSGCNWNFQKATLEGTGSVSCLEQSLTQSGYTLVVTDVQFTGSTFGTITIDEALSSAVVLNTYENIADTVTIDIDEAAMAIRITGAKDYCYKTDRFDLVVGAAIKELCVDGAFSLDVRLPSVNDFSLEINGAVSGSLGFGQLRTLSIEINGAGELTVSGQCDQCTAVLNGAADVDAGSLAVQDCTITINGAGSYAADVAATLQGTINGAGTITYTGNPVVTPNIAGIGSIKPR